MTTKRIYYDDAFAREFIGEVRSCEEITGEDATKWRVVLDRTAFYPTSGGQPNDLGTQGEARVLDVVDEGDEIVHVVDRAVQGSVAGKIDWARRFDHMQQHTGQHLLSAVLMKEFGLETVSFHLGEEICTIDLRGLEPSAETLVAAEQAANAVVFEDRPVSVKYGTAEELRALGVRKEVDRDGVLRAIEIEGVELQPCGGTHVARTGQIGMIQLRRCTKIRQDWRLEFLCGERVAKAARADYETRRAVAEKLKCSPEEALSMVDKTVGERDASFRLAKARGERLADLEAEKIVRETAVDASGLKIVEHVFEGIEASYVLLLAPAIATHEKTVALVARRECGHIFFGQGPGVGKDMNALLKKVLGVVGGKGGGTKDFARGALADPATAQRAIEIARAEVG
ncbi:MAG: alanyl-tRNA editing protein [Acidobacteria bacterium]|nr:alanyl-tRNA editing protein [Acidobacteriota bacterium]MBS1866532.1 alanyl-tRNA editing protein [Acidobacteriota bacterium]